MNTMLQISINDNNTCATLAELPPECDAETVYNAIRYEDISHGIRHDAITQAIKNAKESGNAIRNLCIAEVDTVSYTVQYGKDGAVLSGDDITTMKEDLSAIGLALRGRDYSSRLKNGIFLKATDTVFTVKINQSYTNLFGIEVAFDGKPDIFPRERCIAVKTDPGGYHMIALVTGYLILNEHDAFDIVDPFLASPDKLILYTHVVPMLYGYDAFIDKTIKSAPPKTASASESSISTLSTIEMKEHLYRLELRRGKKPVPGRPGSIRFHVTLDDIPKRRNDPKINYKDISCFKEVKPNTLLAERIPLKQSVPGVNVYGESIDIPKVKDIIFSYGNGVTEEATPDLVRYYAKETGVLEISDNYLNVVPELVIHGDVGNFTGNIRYSRSVLVNGNINNGFKVECGELTVRNSVEDAVEIHCTGDLIVRKGILGERTKVTVDGNARIGLVQSATVRVRGDLTVEEFAYHSKIFCGRKLTINGNGISTREKGCVLGGSLSCLDAMELHSVGSIATLTTLCCGFDPEGQKVLIDSIALEKTLKKKIMQLQNTLHFNPANKAAMLQRIKLFSLEKREAIKRTLQELRQTITQVEKTEATVALLSRKVFARNIMQSYIRVYHHVIAPTLVEFPKLKRKIYRETSGAKLLIVDGEISMYENLTDKED